MCSNNGPIKPHKVIQWVLSDESCYGNLIVNHIVQFINDENKFAKFLEELQVMTLVQHQHVCLIMIKLVEFSQHNIPGIQNQITDMLDKLIEVSLPLCYEKYSNYIIQKILIVGNIDNKSKLLNNIVQNKFGSNVCEKALGNALSYQLQNLWVQCLEYHFKSLVNDDFGNYVMQAYYFYTRQFIDIQNQYMNKICDLNRLMKLNHNGRIAYSYVMQTYQFVQKQMYCNQQQYCSGN